MNREYTHQKTIITTVFSRPDPDGLGQEEQQRQVVISRLESVEFHRACCLLLTEKERLNMVKEELMLPLEEIDIVGAGDQNSPDR